MKRRITSSLAAAALAIVLAGCSQKYYRNSADREAAKVIAEKIPQVPNMDPRFTITQSTNSLLDSLPMVTQTNDFFGTDAAIEVGARVLSLDHALEIAVQQSRLYQNNKERLFLQALDLTLARHRYTPIFGAGANAAVHGQAVDVEKDIETIIGGEVVRQQQLVVDHVQTVRGSGNVGMDLLLSSGARLAVDFSTDFVRFISGDARWATSSRLGATLTQPLLRGAGYKVTMELLTQTDRNLLYELRTFTRFRKEFSVQIASAYYEVLQARDEVRNEWVGLQGFRQNVARVQAFVAEGESTETELGRLQQAELSTEGRWVDALRSYRERLDRFKILLGLPTDTHLVLDQRELEKLELVHPKIAIEDAVRIALENRLDLYNQREQLEDSARKVFIATDRLKADLDLILQGSVGGGEGVRPMNLDWDRAGWSAGLDVDLPLDRKSERNNYRASLIAYERSKRDLALAVDQIKLDVNQGWRALDTARRNYAISELGVGLSQRRLEEQQLKMEVGFGGVTAINLVDAQRDLISSLNQRTSARVRHTIARLQFWRDLGILYIKDNGQWDETKHASR